MTIPTFTRLLLLMALIMVSGFSCNKADSPSPESEESFWPIATPEEKGLDANLLGEAARRAAALDNSYALLIIRDGAIVHEQYMRGRDRHSLLHLRSITKSVVGLLAGIVIEEGHMARQDSLMKFLPELEAPGIHPDWASVTVGHLLDMLSGVRWDETSEVIPWLSNEFDPLDNLFARDFEWAPGEHFNYSTAAVDLLGYVIEAATGTPLDILALSYLAEPLGIKTFEWERDINDKVRAGAGLQRRPRDLAKVGLLFLQEGQWEGRQVVPKAWIGDIRENSIPLSRFYSNLMDLSYRNLWWSDKIDDHRAYYGSGFGGQLLMAIPDLELIIVSHHEYYVDFPQAEEQRSAFLREVFPLIIEAVN